jgi:outer membrane protein OmpA-like peptidoglycan-associated protein
VRPVNLGASASRGDRSESELVHLRKRAIELAAARKERPTTVHLLAAIAGRPGPARDLLATRALDEETLLKAGRTFDETTSDPIERSLAEARSVSKRARGPVSTDPKTNGCPGDTDGDGFRDDQDACPQEKGVDDADPSKRGCPKLVRVTATEIIILEQVQFDTGKSTIKPVSDPLLDSVAEVLKEHPEILKIEVQGHTDNKGSKQLNKKLSGDRATSVAKALEKRGVDKARLVAQGYGQDKPIADNKDEEGRAKNRRVQFVVLEKAPPKGPAGAQPMPAPAKK